ncbi:O-methyltransferase [Magnetospirillum sp. 64-120]|uniref:O-methyltransferase n=1 Tax=Magnetospirillum sp. 64-120 TaxID=1895778 RepID=UPI00092A2476|nr:O-methyltransferase [Magnetospirillum sp. 64-120]OJX70260.1 MAG: methyltransferase [Magnetospirillum sp. 64-120]
MSKDLWTRVDSFFAQSLMPEDPVLQAALQASQDAGLPAINVAPNQGKLLHLMARMAGARRILEIGTLAAYSTIWLARALPAGGSLVTLEADAAHAAVARANIAMAGLQDVVDLREGKALDTLPTLSGPFDFVFIDADKTNNPAYLQWALTLSRPGTTIVFDNVVRNGQVLDPDAEEKVVAVRRLTEILATEPRVSATAVQTVGEKGWDGFILAVVN